MAELVWEGKYRDGKRVEPVRLALPLQTLEAIGESTRPRRRTLSPFARGEPTQWHNRLIWGDKKEVLPSLLPEFAGKINLVYIDPPFYTGGDFSLTAPIPGSEASREEPRPAIELKAYRDTWERGLESYLQWFYETAVLLRELLAERGMLLAHFDDNVAHEAKMVLDEVFGAEKRRGEIIWSLGTGAKSRKFCSIQHNIIFAYSASDDWTFDSEAAIMREPFAQGSLHTHFNRVNEQGRRYRVRTVNGKTYVYYADKGRLIGSVWNDIPSMSANSPILRQSTGYPTQKPEKLLERMVTACSQADDLVLDCFCGSGTTAAVAERLGRRWIACDLGHLAIHTTRKRLLSVPKVRPFVIQKVGKHEGRPVTAAEPGPTGHPVATGPKPRVWSAKHALEKRLATIELVGFAMRTEDLPVRVQTSIKHWSQWIDYWAIDWDSKSDTFHNMWQSYRTREKRALELSARHEYKKPGMYVAMVKVVDLFGLETTKTIALEVL